MEGINPNVGANNGSNYGVNGINNVGPTNGNNIGMTTTMYTTQPFILFMASLNLLDLSQPIIDPLLPDFAWHTCQPNFSKISPILSVILHLCIYGYICNLWCSYLNPDQWMRCHMSCFTTSLDSLP